MAMQCGGIPVANGTVLVVKDVRLPPLVVVAYFPDGEWDEGVPAYFTYALQPLASFSEADREAGLPGYYRVRTAEWVHRDPILEDEGDLVLTTCAVHMVVADLVDFAKRTRVVGRVSLEALAGLERECVALIEGPDSGLTNEELHPRDVFAEVISRTLRNG